MLNSLLGPKKLPLSSKEARLTKDKHVVVEEGVVDYLFSKISDQTKYCVELGAGDGINWSFTRNLLEEKGWAALLIEGNPEWAGKLADKYSENSRVQAISSFITAENIQQLFKENNVPKIFDLLVIDIDGIDYYVWDKLGDYAPQVVCVEYNASWGPHKDFIIDYDPNFRWQEDDYYGASFASLLKLGEKKGYELVHCSSNGDNMIFLKKDLLKNWSELQREPVSLFQPPQYKKYGRSWNGKGHPVSEKTASRAYKKFCVLRYYLMTPLRKLAYFSAKAQGVPVKGKTF